MIRINRNVGARVIVDSVLVGISPKEGWKFIKKVPGVIVEKGDHRMYSYFSDGANTNVNRMVFDPWYPSYAIQLDNGVVEVCGDSIILVYEYHLKFLDRIETPKKPITEKQYLNAKKIVEQYETSNLK